MTAPGVSESLRRKLVLVVDDEPKLVSLMALRLRDSGVQCVEACGGEEGLRVLAAQSIDIVLSDMRMPRVDGIELLRRVRSEDPERGRRIEVVLMTGYSDYRESDVQALGGFALLQKPLSFASLVETLESAAKRVDRDREEE